jgi:hypothetical protein
MNFRRTPKVRQDDDDSDGRPKKLTKLEIKAEEPESERFDFHTQIECRTCNIQIPQSAGNVSLFCALSDIIAFHHYSRPALRTDVCP